MPDTTSTAASSSTPRKATKLHHSLLTVVSPSTGGESSWKGGVPLTNSKGKTARVRFSDREPTLLEESCSGPAIRLSFRSDEPDDDEKLIGRVTKSDLEGMSLWPAYRDGFKTATGVETGMLVDGEFVNVYQGDPIMAIDRTHMIDRETYNAAHFDFWKKNDWKKELWDMWIEED
ncbi:hypothetical protein B9479_002762 [Cryptococcus floricola]|uniref:Uncharacterized protein n=1 Tax=Cryptococcus floricola TaxID=2591691 RepID=A0A5D3AYU4_9TREE|nr:hypothetical protein B9479_002762 [Cryptococcus floricola]